jgi:hypothetical protein
MTNPLYYLHDQIEQWRAAGTYQNPALTGNR